MVDFFAKHFQEVLTGLSSLTALILAFGSIYWNKRIKEAKDSEIQSLKQQLANFQTWQQSFEKSKESEIKVLNHQLNTVKELTSEKIQAHFLKTKESLESIIDGLEDQLEILQHEKRDLEDIDSEDIHEELEPEEWQNGNDENRSVNPEGIVASEINHIYINAEYENSLNKSIGEIKKTIEENLPYTVSYIQEVFEKLLKERDRLDEDRKDNLAV